LQTQNRTDEQHPLLHKAKQYQHIYLAKTKKYLMTTNTSIIKIIMKHILCVSQPKEQTIKPNTNKKMYLMPNSEPLTTSTGASDDGNSAVIVIVDTDGEYIDTTKLSSKIKYPAILMHQRIAQDLRGHIR